MRLEKTVSLKPQGWEVAWHAGGAEKGPGWQNAEKSRRHTVSELTVGRRVGLCEPM